MPAATILPMIRYLVDASATASHTFAVELRIAAAGPRAAPEPAGLDSRQLPGARVRAPPLGARRRAGRPRRCRSSSSTRRPGSLAAAATPSWCCAIGSMPSTLSVRAAFLDADRGFFNGTGLCLRVEGREAEPHRARARRPARRTGRSRRRSRRSRVDAAAHGTTSPPTTTSWSTTRSSSAASGAAASAPRGVAARVRRRRRLARLRRRAPARRRAAHLRGRRSRSGTAGGEAAVRPLPVPAQRRRRRPRRPRAPRQHGAGRAAPRPAATADARQPRRGRHGRAGQPATATPTCSA